MPKEKTKDIERLEQRLLHLEQTALNSNKEIEFVRIRANVELCALRYKLFRWCFMAGMLGVVANTAILNWPDGSTHWFNSPFASVIGCCGTIGLTLFTISLVIKIKGGAKIESLFQKFETQWEAEVNAKATVSSEESDGLSDPIDCLTE